MVHVAMVTQAGFRSRMRAMITGSTGHAGHSGNTGRTEPVGTPEIPTAIPKEAK
jgi:hypothetical protein